MGEAFVYLENAFAKSAKEEPHKTLVTWNKGEWAEGAPVWSDRSLFDWVDGVWKDENDGVSDKILLVLEWATALDDVGFQINNAKDITRSTQKQL